MIDPKKLALGVLSAAATKLVLGGHRGCAEATKCLPLEDLRLSALSYTLETLRQIAAKRTDETRKPGQASPAAMKEVVEELRATLLVLIDERAQLEQRADDDGATQPPGQA